MEQHLRQVEDAIGLMKMTPANPSVGNWRNNGPDMLNFA